MIDWSAVKGGSVFTSGVTRVFFVGKVKQDTMIVYSQWVPCRSEFIEILTVDFKKLVEAHKNVSLSHDLNNPDWKTWKNSGGRYQPLFKGVTIPPEQAMSLRQDTKVRYDRLLDDIRATINAVVMSSSGYSPEHPQEFSVLYPTFPTDEIFFKEACELLSTQYRASGWSDFKYVVNRNNNVIEFTLIAPLQFS